MKFYKNFKKKNVVEIQKKGSGTIKNFEKYFKNQEFWENIGAIWRKFLKFWKKYWLPIKKNFWVSSTGPNEGDMNFEKCGRNWKIGYVGENKRKFLRNHETILY